VGGGGVTAFVAGWAIARDVEGIAAEAPALWREIRRFNTPVKLALAAAHRALGVLEDPRTARLVGLAPCWPGSPELRGITRELDAGFARGSCAGLRVNPIYTLHAIDNLALSALSLRLENHEPCVCLGGAAGQAWAALEIACEELAAGNAREVLILGGDAHGEDACGAALVVTARPQRVRLVEIERSVAPAAPPEPHAARGLVRWLTELERAAGSHRHVVAAEDGDGIDRITIVTEVA
jgi:hypothetical protein